MRSTGACAYRGSGDIQQKKKVGEKAAAIKYDEAENGSPKVAVRGQGHAAEKIHGFAQQYGVQVHRDKDLLELLTLANSTGDTTRTIYSGRRSTCLGVSGRSWKIGGISMKIRLWILLLCAVAGAKNGVDVVYLGLVEGGAPALEKQFDLTMRENLSTLPQVSLIDYRKTIEFVKHIGFNGSPELSRSLIEYLQKFCSDSTVIIWGRVERYNIQTARRFLIRSFASGELIIAFKVYSLSFKDYAFSGDIGFKTTIPKGLIGFGDVKEQVHVSAQDIVDISQNLCSNVSRQTVHSIQSIIRSEIMRISDRQENVGTLDKTQEPAIGDVFDMPSMDAPSVAPQSIDTAAVKQ